MGPDRLDPFRGDDHDLSGQYIANELGSNGVQRAGLTADHPGSACGPAYTQRPESVRVAERDHPGRGHDDAGVGAADRGHRLLDRLCRTGGMQAMGNDRIGDRLRVGSAVEDSSRQFELFTQFRGIDEVPVVREGHVALDVPDDERLDVAEALSAGRRITDMADRHISFPQRVQAPFREHLMDQSIAFVVSKDAVIVDDDATSLLPPVLESIEGKVSSMCDVCRFWFQDAKYATFFM